MGPLTAERDLDRVLAELDEVESDPVEERLDELETAIAARFQTHELAIAELARRIPPEEAHPKTVFGVEVVLEEGVTDEDVRKYVAELPPALRSAEVLDRLEKSGLLRRVKR